MQTNSDFDKYINTLNEITNIENRAELESFYTLHSAVLQFFKAIDKAIQDILKKSNVSEAVIKQLENVLPTLTKLKKEISKLDSEIFAVGYKTKISQSVTNIKNGMTLSEANDTAQEFFELLEENKQSIIAEEQENERQRKKIEEQERKEKKQQQKQEENERKKLEKEHTERLIQKQKIENEQMIKARLVKLKVKKSFWIIWSIITIWTIIIPFACLYTIGTINDEIRELNKELDIISELKTKNL